MGMLGAMEESPVFFLGWGVLVTGTHMSHRMGTETRLTRSVYERERYIYIYSVSINGGIPKSCMLFLDFP